MRALIQRTFKSALSVDGKLISEIPSGLTIFLGIEKGDNAELPDRARYLYERVTEKIREEGIVVKNGVFGAHMFIEQQQDGPLSFVFEC